MSQVLFHIRHRRALSTVLAVPAVSLVEENEMRRLEFSHCFFDAEYTLDRGVFSAHQAGIFFSYPYPPRSLRFPFAGGLPVPPLCRQRNSFVIQHLKDSDSESLRV